MDSGQNQPPAPPPDPGQRPAPPPQQYAPVQPYQPSGPYPQPQPHHPTQAYPPSNQQPQPYYPVQPYYVPAGPSNGVGTAAGVLGIIALVLSFIPILDFIGIVLGILAVILGAVGIQRANALGGAGKGMAIAGLVCGLISVALAFIIIAAFYSAAHIYGP